MLLNKCCFLMLWAREQNPLPVTPTVLQSSVPGKLISWPPLGAGPALWWLQSVSSLRGQPGPSRLPRARPRLPNLPLWSPEEEFGLEPAEQPSALRTDQQSPHVGGLEGGPSP